MVVAVKFDLGTSVCRMSEVCIYSFLSQAKISGYVEQPHAPIQTN